MDNNPGGQRRFPRIGSENAVLVKKIAPDRAEGFVKTRVVGLGGCMFVTDELLGVGALVELLIAVSGRIVKASGRVVYEIPKESQTIEVGIEFLELEDSDRKVIEGLFSSPTSEAPTPG